MSHKNKVPLVDQVLQTLNSKLAIGRSKYNDKLAETKPREITSNYIFSCNTYRSYLRHGCYFVLWCKEKYRCKTLEQCRRHVDDWLEHRKALSASTQKLDANSLAKIFGCSTTEFIKTDARLRENFKRSRGKKKMDAHFSEKKNWELVEFCKSAGLRRAELSALYGNCLKEEDGRYLIIVQSGSKGRKYREAPVIGNVDLVIRKMNEAGKKRSLLRFQVQPISIPTELIMQLPFILPMQDRLTRFRSVTVTITGRIRKDFGMTNRL